MTQWLFLTNHALVLGYLTIHPEATVLETSLAVGIQERQTRKIISELEANGYLSKNKVGRNNIYSVHPQVPLRHKLHQDTPIGELLKTMGWVPGRKRKIMEHEEAPKECS